MKNTGNTRLNGPTPHPVCGKGERRTASTHTAGVHTDGEASRRGARMRFVRSVAPILPALAALASVAPAEDAWNKTGDYYHEARGPGEDVGALASQLPFAYYPSVNRMEVALAIPEKYREQVAANGRKVVVRVLGKDDGQEKARAVVTVDEAFTAREAFDVPAFPDGEYAVEYGFGRDTMRSPQTFKRIRFPWEGNRLGLETRVYAPYTPVTVEGNKVSVVLRTYAINAFGLLDSLRSQDRELLAAPMRIVCETAAGPVDWTPGEATGRRVNEGQAVFACGTESPACTLEARTTVEEDGFAQVDLTLAPTATPVEIRRLWVEIALKDEEAPLFHYSAYNEMRHNYGGVLPRGGKAVWESQWPAAERRKGWVPMGVRVEPGESDGEIWSSKIAKQHGNLEKTWWRPFVPYILLGGIERGLAWMGESDRGYVVDVNQPAQTINREGDRVVLRVYLIQTTHTLTEPRRISFALQGTPTRPMPVDYRTRGFFTGIGPVMPWGSYGCSSKYPDRRDFSIVDKIQEGRRTGVLDEAWFRERAKTRLWPERWTYDQKVRESTPERRWTDSVLVFARRAAEEKRGKPGGGGVYFEEHAVDTWTEEWEVFQDEWTQFEFPRFQKGWAKGNWGVSRSTYQDFAVYYAHEWLRRGVSLYFDNTNLKFTKNPRFSSAYRAPDGKMRWGTEIFGARRYYRRIWKLMQEVNARLEPENGVALAMTFHMTNTDEVPFASWCTAVLELEQAYINDAEGDRLPWPMDYCQAVLMNRRSGAIDLPLDLMRGYGRHEPHDKSKPPVLTPEVYRAEFGMGIIHNGRGGQHPHWVKEAQPARDLRGMLNRFGYGTDQVRCEEYWNEGETSLAVSNPNIAWMMVSKVSRDEQPSRAILLQSYGKAEQTTGLALPEPGVLVDAITREAFTTDAAGKATVVLGPGYGTRLLICARDRAAIDAFLEP